MKAEHKKIGDILVVTPVENRIDASLATSFKSRMADWVSEGNDRILLDLSNVDFVDSSGLGAILSSLKTLGKNGDLVICSINDTVKSLFELTRMHRILRIFSSQEEVDLGGSLQRRVVDRSDAC